MKISLETEVKSIRFYFDGQNNVEIQAKDIAKLYVQEFLHDSKQHQGHFEIALKSGFKIAGPVDNKEQLKDLRFLFDSVKHFGDAKWQKTL